MKPATTAPRALVAGAILLFAFNLRPAVNSLGAVVPELRAATGMSGAVSGVLLSLPTLAFAVLGLAAPALARRLGSHLTVLCCLVVLIVGQLLRALVAGPAALFGGSVLALAGIAIGNVLLPGLVRLHFPSRVNAMTAAYTALLTGGGALGAAVSLPIEHAVGGDWRTAVGIWAVTAAVALLPWLPLARPGSSPRPATGGALSLAAVARTRLGWVLAVYFGTQALLAYVMFGWLAEILTTAGVSQTMAALQVGIVTAIGIPMAIIAPTLAGRIRSPSGVVVAFSISYVIGLLGLMLAPGRAVTVFTVLIGIGGGSFPLALTFVALRARTHEATTSLSAFTQSAGYLIASAGPIGVGVLHDAVGGWTVPLIVLCGVAVIQAIAGIGAGRQRFVEDELPRAAAARTA